jgi:ATP adenylyltransferase
MDQLYSPWRFSYVSKSTSSVECIFCAKLTSGSDRKNLVLHRGKLCFAMLNLYPYSSGHLMIAPYAHIAALDEADDDLVTELMLLTKAAQNKLRTVYRAPGFNIGMNIGACAGAGVAGHIHMHVLPRWPADANFMTTTAETRVLPEDLNTTYDKLLPHFN